MNDEEIVSTTPLPDGSEAWIVYRRINGESFLDVNRIVDHVERGSYSVYGGDASTQRARADVVVDRLRSFPDYYRPRSLNVWRAKLRTLRDLFVAFEAAAGEPVRLVTFGEDYRNVDDDWWPDKFSGGLWRPADLPDSLLDDECVRFNDLRLTGWSDSWVMFLAEYDSGYCTGLWWVPRDPTDHHPIHPMDDEA